MRAEGDLLVRRVRVERLGESGRHEPVEMLGEDLLGETKANDRQRQSPLSNVADKGLTIFAPSVPPLRVVTIDQQSYLCGGGRI